MIFTVEDNGDVLVRMHSEGQAARAVTHASAQRHIDGIITDMVRNHFTIATDEIQVKRRGQLTDVYWYAHVPPRQVDDTRGYFDTLARSEAGEA